MRNSPIETLTLAALLHDVGKFAERADMPLPAGYQLDNAGLYQPYSEVQKRHTHRHALYTAAFIERHAAHLPELTALGDAKSGDSLINLAAMHHKPETPLQWVIAVADRLSSGLDRQTFEGDEAGIAFRDFRKTRLIPIAEELLRPQEFYTGDGPETYRFRYRLEELSPDQVFPAAKGDVEPCDDEAAKTQYRLLFTKFTENLERLEHQRQPALWLDHFLSLWERTTSAIPAATVGKVIPDVSLYDHSRATAALAAALFRYHEVHDNLVEKSIQDQDAEKFLLITGDFYGIQNFIFSEGGSTNRAAAKILRGRSFAVSLLAELAAETLCRALGLPQAAILLNAAGKFTLLAPNLPDTPALVHKVEKDLNQWLVHHFLGETAIGFSMVTASGNDFSKGRFPLLWERLAQAGEARKCRKIDLGRHGGVVSDYLDRFDNRLSPALCPFCGKRPAEMKTRGKPLLGDNEAACGICYDHIQLGAHLIRSDRLALMDRDADFSGNRLMEPLFGRYQLAFDLSDAQAAQLASAGHLLALRHLARAGGCPGKGLAMRYISGYVPIYRENDSQDIERLLHGRKSAKTQDELFDMIKEGGAKSFHHIAKSALRPRADAPEKFTGTEALGILKADVDNLGKLFACGLPSERLNLSRLATFSRQMNNFFSLYLPHLLATESQFSDIYTVFAGGDDLFLIGPWNRIIEFSGVLREAFARFGCGNPQVTLSAGININKPGIPVPALAEQAEDALGAAKNGGRNALTLFGETVGWDQFQQLEDIRRTLEQWQTQGYIGKAMLYRLNELLHLAGREQQLRAAGKPVSLADLECLAWRSKFHYTAVRNVGKALDKETRGKALDDVMRMARWLDEFNAKLKIALWQVLYNQR
ncbi:type III-A CRISPR-associated protein Cas10/Csm1 [Geoalkalibacter sp.]|uniref:type III-A CRISPR-associated protein Cas10/Csm1 n=1 Tax=Geoalkalibacter sp. TaxID=3041440 RepID=UPI00272EBCC1|nr:type III-A CRISPR-associated protein Cas10/Csm1 [Geoalkalibacter sp.]